MSENQIIAVVVGVGLVFILAVCFSNLYVTHPYGNRRAKSRRLAYSVSVLLVFVASVVLGNEMEPCPVRTYAHMITLRAFLLALVPVLIGVRLGLGSKRH